MAKIKRSKSTVTPLTFVVRLTKSEVLSFNSFVDERMMAFNDMSPKPKLRIEQEEHLRAVMFNGLVAAYLGGIQTKNRAYKLVLQPATSITIIKKRK